MSQPTYIASCSFGKDSIATILLALEHDEPLDRVVFSEVMFDHARNISGEIPEHIGWIYDTAIPKLHDMGIHVDVVRAERDYCYFFANAVGGGRMQERFTGSRSAANASSIGIAKSRPYENTSPKLLAVPCVPSGKFVALSYNGFDFNIHDVCLTPNRPVRLFNHHCIVEVKTAQSPTGRWDYGLDVNLHNSGHYVGAGFVDDVQKGYPTEAAAILAALLDARKSAERELANCSGRSRSNLDNEDDEDGFIKDSTLAPYIRNIIKQIDDQRRATAFKQLTLF